MTLYFCKVLQDKKLSVNLVVDVLRYKKNDMLASRWIFPGITTYFRPRAPESVVCPLLFPVEIQFFFHRNIILFHQRFINIK
jgi:hypothetical protein